MDGVHWQPAAREGNSSTYILSSPGRCTIFMGSAMVFTFANNLQLDFDPRQASMQAYDVQGGSRLAQKIQTPYVQSPFINGAGFLVIASSPTAETYDNATALNFTCNQNDAVLSTKTVTASYIRVEVTQFSTNEPLAIFLGNVLVAYFYNQ